MRKSIATQFIKVPTDIPSDATFSCVARYYDKYGGQEIINLFMNCMDVRNNSIDINLFAEVYMQQNETLHYYNYTNEDFLSPHFLFALNTCLLSGKVFNVYELLDVKYKQLYEDIIDIRSQENFNKRMLKEKPEIYIKFYYLFQNFITYDEFINTLLTYDRYNESELELLEDLCLINNDETKMLLYMKV